MNLQFDQLVNALAVTGVYKSLKPAEVRAEVVALYKELTGPDHFVSPEEAAEVLKPAAKPEDW